MRPVITVLLPTPSGPITATSIPVGRISRHISRTELVITYPTDCSGRRVQAVFQNSLRAPTTSVASDSFRQARTACLLELPENTVAAMCSASA